MIEPPATPWLLPAPTERDGDLIGIGADLEPGTILAAYRSGLFPMPVEGRGLGWWSPDPRGILPPGGLRVSRSLRRSCARFEVRVDGDVEAVIDACADPSRAGRWITPRIKAAYLRLHDLGWVHSVEAWSSGGRLAGGLYGVCIGGLFAGESMFHRQSDASKVALVGLTNLLGPTSLLDVQWRTGHLETLGVIEVPRVEYLRRLRVALDEPPPFVWNGAETPPFVANPGGSKFGP